MKNLLLLLLFSLLSLMVNAQEDRKNDYPFIYLGASVIDVGNYLGQGIDLNYIHKEKMSFSIGVNYNLYATENYPKDNADVWITNGISSSKHLYLTVGRIVKVKNSKRFRLNLSAGLAKTWNSVEENFVRGNKIDDEYYYDYDRNEYETVSLVLSPKLEFPIFSVIGLQVSPKVVLNKKRNFYGLGVGLMLGKLR